MDGGTGIVLVLLPGGRFQMGSQSKDPTAPNYDPMSQEAEWPVHTVRLSPFLLSRYEMTRGQWTRMTASKDPSAWTRETSGNRIQEADYARHPVECVTWLDCVRELGRGDLALPTESQWEYGARADSDRPWSFGTNGDDFPDHANLADEDHFQALPHSSAPYEKEKRDGYPVTAPVGSYHPNAFGLHDTSGNVWEWVQDEWVAYHAAEFDGDRSRTPSGAGVFVCRGGCFSSLRVEARPAGRNYRNASYANSGLGVRPARRLRP